MPISQYRPREFGGGYNLRGSYRLAVSTGAVTTIAAGTSTAGHLFAWRWSNATAARCILRYVGAKFTLTTAYGTAQETAIDMILARSYTVSDTGATAVDTGSTVTGTGKFMTAHGTSLMGVAGLVRVADTGALTAGTHTLDANPWSRFGGWSGTIGDTIPRTGSSAQDGYGALFDARGAEVTPIVFNANEGFKLRNGPIMGASGVGRWDIVVEWDEGTPVP